MNRQLLKSFRRATAMQRYLESKLVLLACALVFPAATFAVDAENVARPQAVMLPAGATVTEIQDALNSLPVAGGEVILPAGKIEVSQPIVLSREGQTLRGAGDQTILFLADNANCPVIIMGEPVDDPKQVRNLRVSDLFIDGNRAHQQRECWQLKGDGSGIRNNGITVQNVSDSVVENVTTARCRSGGLVTTLGTRHFTVRHLNSFDNEFDGLACFLTEDSHFTQLNLHDNVSGAGISLDGNFNHNVIDGAVLAGNDLGIFMRWSHDNEFHDISISGSLHDGVFMAENIGQTSIGQLRTDCTNNSFNKLMADRCGGVAFRVNDITCTNNFVSEAKFSGDIHAQLSLALPGLLMVK